jgi:hypothetical protein
MGAIIDLEKVEIIYRCNHVKRGIVWINLIGPPISLLFLTFGITRMFLVKKRKSLLTNIIILIFFSEIIQCLSKLIQLLKYTFPDRRDDKNFYDGNTPRGVICQIQITTAIFSDFCSLLNTLLLSLRCYDVIKNKKRFFDKGNHGIISIFMIVITSIILANSFLIIDKKLTKNNRSYRFDVRDRCSYWCWLDHYSSLMCFSIYSIIIVINMVFAWKTNSFLTRGYKSLLEENESSYDAYNNMSTPLNEVNNEDNSKKMKFHNLTKETIERIEELRLMRIKCFIYPLVTIILWVIIAIYRIIDDLAMMKYDEGDDPKQGRIEEQNYFKNNPFSQFIVQMFLVLHAFLSATRGIFYGFSFIVFEEKLFFNFFKKCFKKSWFEDEPEGNEEGRMKIIRNSNYSATSSDYIKENEKEGEDDENKDENEDEDENKDDESKGGVIEMNNSEYNDNNNDNED